MRFDRHRPTRGAGIRNRIAFVIRERWFRNVVLARRSSDVQGFFDAYPLFFTTSATRPERNRLNQRHRALIESNAEIIAGRRILDLASHDGRWTFAAHKGGARYVLGIEARKHLIEASHSNMHEYGAPESQAEFIHADVLTELDRLEPGFFDTVFCFGFLYHTIDHMAILRKIARLRPSNLIIDSAISVLPSSIVEVREERIDHESNGAVGELGAPGHCLKGKPTKPALELMLKAAGFQKLRYYDWQNAAIGDWRDLEAYYLGSRVSITADAHLKAHLELDAQAGRSAPEALLRSASITSAEVLNRKITDVA